MKVYLLLIFSLVFATLSLGQNIYISEDINLRKDRNYELVGQVGPYIIMGEYNLDRLEIYLFDDRLKLISVNQKQIDDKRVDIQGVFGTKEELHVIYTVKNKDKLYFLDKSYSPNLSEVGVDTIAHYTVKFFRPEIRFSQSDNRNMLGIVLRNNSNVEQIISYDMSRHQTLINYETFIENNNRNEFRKSMVSDRGEIFLVNEVDNFRARLDGHSFLVYSFVPRYEGVYTRTINVSEFLTFDADFTFDNRLRTMSIAGLYSIGNTAESEGLFYTSFNPIGEEPSNMYRVAFTSNFLKNYYNKTKVRKNSAIDLVFQKVIRRQDGGFILMFEELSQYNRWFTGTTPQNSFYNSTYSMDHHYEDLYVYSVGPDGSLEWEASIPKNQYSSDDDGQFSSFFLFENPNHVRFVYNDEVKKNNTISEVIVLSNGYTRRNTLLRIPSNDLLIQVSNGMQISNNEVLFPAMERGDLKLAKFEFVD